MLLETVRRHREEVCWQGSTAAQLLGHWNNKKARKNILAAKRKKKLGKKRKKMKENSYGSSMSVHSVGEGRWNESWECRTRLLVVFMGSEVCL